MSFSGEVKSEAARKSNSARHCNIAEAAALITFGGRMLADTIGTKRLRIQTENAAVSRKCFTLLKKTFNINTDVIIEKNIRLKKGNTYILELVSPEDIGHVMLTCKLTETALSAGGIAQSVHPLLVQKNCCKRAFIRGAFLAAGSLTDPEKSYHLEIVCRNYGQAEQLQEIMQHFELSAKITERKNVHVVYIKDSAQIIQMLGIMEANVALMDMENTRILKEMRNTVNRKVNCETANINKTVSAAVKQLADIEFLKEQIGLAALPDELAQTAECRLRYPEASLKELGEMAQPPIGRSGMNHRLRKISKLAEEIRGETSITKEELL
ncbi:MAG: DNA-binding protein WhiA [Lachnospiraceae bacterium]